MRRPRWFVEDHERILFVVDDRDTWYRQADIIKHAQMAPARAVASLKALTQSGELEWSKLFRGRGHGSGRPAFIYRRRQTQEAA